MPCGGGEWAGIGAHCYQTKTDGVASQGSDGSHEAEAVLTGKAVSAAAFREAAEAALAGARPQRQNAFKVELAKRTIVRALQTVSGGVA